MPVFLIISIVLLKQYDGQGQRTDILPEGGHPKLTQKQAAANAGLSDHQSKKEGALHSAPTQRDAASKAGLSEHQTKTAVRVANVPGEQFEIAIES